MNSKFRCLTIGYIEARKGQDILVEAVRMLDESVRDGCEFLLVGQDTSLLAQGLKKSIENLPAVRILGTADREGIHSILETAALLVVPSREDPMPTVAAEAMMHSVPCIVSDAAGTAGYLTEGRDGWIFESGNALELSRKIAWCFYHREEVERAGTCARELYEKVFSMEVFRKNLLALVDGIQVWETKC